MFKEDFKIQTDIYMYISEDKDNFDQFLISKFQYECSRV